MKKSVASHWRIVILTKFVVVSSIMILKLTSFANGISEHNLMFLITATCFSVYNGVK